MRIVLTAHPTQFYPGSALGIITDLTEVVRRGDFEGARDLLHQLGLTPFFQEQAPTPYDEAVRQGWYLEHVFYPALPALVMRVGAAAEVDPMDVAAAFDIGFWPGGDRDGNPFVDAETTLRVASRLRLMLLRCYRRELRALEAADHLQGRARHVGCGAVLGGGGVVVQGCRVSMWRRPCPTSTRWRQSVRRNYGGLHVLEIQRLQGGAWPCLASTSPPLMCAKTAACSGALRRPWASPATMLRALMATKTARCLASADVSDDVERDAVEVMAAIRDIQLSNGAEGLPPVHHQQLPREPRTLRASMPWPGPRLTGARCPWIWSRCSRRSTTSLRRQRP